MTAIPDVRVVLPVYNSAGSVLRAAQSVLRQRGVRTRLVIVDHGSSDRTLELSRGLAAEHANVEVLPLRRAADEVRSPSRPLNEGIRHALRDVDDPVSTWIFRLDADDFLVSDDVIAAQLDRGGGRKLIMATLIFFEPATGGAIDYGPRPGRRSLRGLPGRDVYAVAHHATAMRADLLSALFPSGPIFDPTLETGEDLGVTCRLVAGLDGDESQFSFVDAPYCFKELTASTITGSLPLRRVWLSHRRLLREHHNLGAFIIFRGLAEAALTRVIGEAPARRFLQHAAGRNGHYVAVDYRTVRQRIRELTGEG